MPGTRFTDIRRFETLDSTNRYLLEEARNGAPDGVVAVAGHQSAGRGRLGRRWEAPAGANLLLSVLLRPHLPHPHRHLAGAVVALAAAEAAESVAGLRLGLKWPNDLLGADGRKVAGVLAEGDLSGGTGSPGSPGGFPGSPGSPGSPGGSPGSPGSLPAAIVVGIGINVNWPAADADLPPDLTGVATSLRQQAGHPVDRDRLQNDLLRALEPRRDDLDTAAGRLRQADEFRSRCTTIGTPVRIELANSEFEGMAVDVTAEGHLVVEVEGTTRTVVAGDVVHVRPPA
jgi:BirA family biotin operon repressor/biotin-[acetyl-CoA-carboxylase] ligase